MAERSRREHGKPGWMPEPRFRFFSDRVPVSGREIRKGPLESPRPIDWLGDLRTHPLSNVTARDHLILEILASIVYEAMLYGSAIPIVAGQMKLLGGQYAVKLSSVIGIASIAGIETREALIRCLDRLQNATFLLPAPQNPGLRTSRKQLIAQKRVRAGLDEPVERPSGQPFSPRMTQSDFQVYEEMKAEAARENRRARGRQSVDGVIDDRRPRRHLETTLPILGPYLNEQARSRPRDLTKEVDFDAFCPLQRYVIGGRKRTEAWLVFEPAATLVQSLDRDRLVGWKRVPYLFLDLRAFAKFSCRYSPALYRRSLSETYSRALRRPRYDETWAWSPTPDEVSKITSHARQAGGWRGQLERNVIRPFLKDMAKLDSDHLSMEYVAKPHRQASDERFHLSITLPLPDVRKIGTYVTNLDGEAMRRLLPPELPPYRASIGLLLKARTLLRLDHDGFTRLALAWRLGIDEIHNENAPYYEDLTGKGDSRRYRGTALRNQIRNFGTDKAFLGFALEEGRAPDLMKQASLDRLQYEGTLDYADIDRMYRIAQARHGFQPAKVIRTRRTEGLQEHLAEREALRTARADKNAVARQQKHASRVAHRKRLTDFYDREEWKLDNIIKTQYFNRLTSEEKARVIQQEERYERDLETLFARIDAANPRTSSRLAMDEIELMFEEFLEGEHPDAPTASEGDESQPD
ncbi:hypothetical protein [Aurantimonas coralicida]|uniref:hypothetical protein n=1 Tax=Aurantimonas coralicida TaxID=182270 RepID=UPI00165DE9DD|nr:hypothetical protein [Aurantimonas coralicida]MCC4298508.1 hypothetical protein [Aurantimonas coralicida]